MQFTTPIRVAKAKQSITYNHKVLLLGSCFATHIGQKFDAFQFQHLVNPFGILFHPVALEKVITRAINEDWYTKDDVFFHNEQYHCYDAHSQLSATTSAALISALNEALQQLKDALQQSTYCILTMGTAWVYRHIATDTYVANCHKIPQKQFLKELLTVEEVAASIENCITLIRDLNPSMQFIFTVSPVRHIKDGMVENARSKAHLLAGVQQLVDARKGVFYFPSYEIMMDELRDYRSTLR